MQKAALYKWKVVPGKEGETAEATRIDPERAREKERKSEKGTS